MLQGNERQQLRLVHTYCSFNQEPDTLWSLGERAIDQAIRMDKNCARRSLNHVEPVELILFLNHQVREMVLCHFRLIVLDRSTAQQSYG